jgi:hypothetical protein
VNPEAVPSPEVAVTALATIGDDQVGVRPLTESERERLPAELRQRVWRGWKAYGWGLAAAVWGASRVAGIAPDWLPWSIIAAPVVLASITGVKRWLAARRDLASGRALVLRSRRRTAVVLLPSGQPWRDGEADVPWQQGGAPR